MHWVIHTGNFIHDFSAGCEFDTLTTTLVESLLPIPGLIFSGTFKLQQAAAIHP